MDILTTVIPFFGVIIAVILTVLPTSPLSAYINQLSTIPWLSVANWFIPIPEMIAVMETWLTAYVVYLAYKSIMKYIKVI